MDLVGPGDAAGDGIRCADDHLRTAPGHPHPRPLDRRHRSVRGRAARRPGCRRGEGRASRLRRDRAVDRHPGRWHQRAVPDVQPRQAVHRGQPRRTDEGARSCASSPRSRRRRAELAARRRRAARRRLRRPASATTSCTCRSRASATRGPTRDKGAYDTVIQAYGGIGCSQAPGDRQAGLRAPGARRQGHRAHARARRSPRRCSRASAATADSTCKLSMLDAVVSFMWVDGAGNEMLLDGDGSQPGELLGRALGRSASPTVGRVATPTGDSDFFGMCRAFGVDGWDDPRVASPVVASAEHRPDPRAHRAGATKPPTTMTTAEGMARMEAERVPCGVVLSARPSSPTIRTCGHRPPRRRRAPVAGRIRQPRHPALFDDTPATLGGPAPTLGAAHRRRPHRARLRRPHRGVARLRRRRVDPLR